MILHLESNFVVTVWIPVSLCGLGWPERVCIEQANLRLIELYLALEAPGLYVKLDFYLYADI